MKNSIDLAFKNSKKEGRPALISYTVCGDNNKKVSLEILKSISKNLDIVEWGVAHNCPTADGKEIQNSSYRALKNGIKLNDIFQMVKMAPKHCKHKTMDGKYSQELACKDCYLFKKKQGLPTSHGVRRVIGGRKIATAKR